MKILNNEMICISNDHRCNVLANDKSLFILHTPFYLIYRRGEAIALAYKEPATSPIPCDCF